MIYCGIKVEEPNRGYTGLRACDKQAKILASVSDLFTGTRFFAVHPDYDKIDRNDKSTGDFTIPMCRTHRNALLVNITEEIDISEIE